MIAAAGFVLAAAFGTLVRAEAGRRWNRHEGLAFGTLTVNVAGSFLAGLAVELDPPAATLLVVGALGALTTFSSFARDAVALAGHGRVKAAAFYVSATCVLGIAAASAGVAIVST